MAVSRQQRFFLICLFFACVSGIIGLRLLWLHIFRAEYLARKAAKQYIARYKISAQRGRLLDCKGNVLAEDVVSFSVYAQPDKINKKSLFKLCPKLAEILNVEASMLAEKLNSGRKFVWLKRYASPGQKRKIEKLKVKGIGFIRNDKRFFPDGRLLANVLGFVGIDKTGLEGLEAFYNRYLQPRQGLAEVLRDSRGRILPLYEKYIPAAGGFDVVLNIDCKIQYWVEYFLEKAVKEFRAKAGSVVVMEPFTGKILAIADFPTFDPNRFYEYPKENIRSRAICDLYEPGSVFKLVTLTAAVDTKSGLLKKKFFCENGAYKIPRSILHDWKSFGWLKFDEVFKNSSNIGVAKIARELGPKVVFEYAKKLGFGRKTGIDFFSEPQGILRDWQKWSKTSDYIIPIGQGVSVSLIQLVRAYAVIANGGYLVRPYLADKIIDAKGVVIRRNLPVLSGPVISHKTDVKVKKILSEVVSEGTGRRARLKNIAAAGKTGTSQKIGPDGKYSHSRFYASFVGFFPVSRPKVVIGIRFDEPKKYHYGGMTAAVLFKDIGSFIADYLNLRSKDEKN